MSKLIRFDWAAKKLLRSKANFGILEGFLSELLLEDIKIKNLIESESNKEKESSKSNRVDLLVENAAGELIIIEIQNTNKIDYLQRILFGTSKVIVEYKDTETDYSNIKKVISDLYNVKVESVNTIIRKGKDKDISEKRRNSGIKEIEIEEEF